jgi:hypothetical protein
MHIAYIYTLHTCGIYRWKDLESTIRVYIYYYILSKNILFIVFFPNMYFFFLPIAFEFLTTELLMKTQRTVGIYSDRYF